MSEARLSESDFAALFARAKERADIVAVAGVTLYRSGNRLRGPCPACSAGVKSKRKADGAFWVNREKGTWGCFACQKGGDAIDLEAELGKRTKVEAARYLAGPDFTARAPAAAVRDLAPANRGATSPSATINQARTDRTAADLWRQARPAEGTIARTYLEKRGLFGPILTAGLRNLRFHPAAYWGTVEGVHIRKPALIGQVMTPAGPTGGIHATYLHSLGLRKTAWSPAKRMWGPQVDAEGRPGGVWLIGPDILADAPVLIGEGIESSLAAAILAERPLRVAAALSLDRLQGGMRKDRFGRIDPTCIGADFDRPAFTWPGVGEAWAAIDRDMRPIPVKVRSTMGRTVDRPLSGDERSHICAGLFSQQWRRAGAREIRTIAPAAGRDFCDELRAVTGEC